MFITPFKIQQIIECIDKKRWIILVCNLKQIIYVIITRFCSLYIPAPSIYGTGKLWSALDIARWRLITSYTMGEIGSIRLLSLLTLCFYRVGLCHARPLRVKTIHKPNIKHWMELNI
jgi:hypothetical protein